MTPSTTADGEPESDCWAAALPLSALLGNDPGDPERCFDGATPSFAVENEREGPHAVAVDLASGDGHAETYDLAPEERTVERRAFEVGSEVVGTVRLDDEEEYAVEWPERSCYRHGIALTGDGIEIGWIEPLQGPGDTQHDCYPGDDVPIVVRSEGEARTVTVTVIDPCAGTSDRETLELDADGRERIDGALESGGAYEVALGVDGGGSGSGEFDEVCWGVNAAVDGDGEVRVDQVAID